jgi:hypothetical protein
VSDSDEGAFGRKLQLRRHVIEPEVGRGRSAAAAHVPTVGKRTLTEGLSAGYSEIDAIAFFERSRGAARAQLARLERACAAADRVAAVTAAGMLRIDLRTAREHASHGPRSSCPRCSG